MSRFSCLDISEPRLEHGGLRFVTAGSPALKGRGNLCVYVPPAELAPPEAGPLPVITLLHGLFGAEWNWPLKGAAHHTAERLMRDGHLRPCVLAMPSDGFRGDGTGYFAHGGRDYERWIVEDVHAALVELNLRCDADSPRCIAGLSMGGFGAMYLAARHPDTFHAASGLSPAVDLTTLPERVAHPDWSFDPGTPMPRVIETLRAADRLPPFRFDCGRDDELFAGNVALHEQLDDAGIPHTFVANPGAHDWPYWTAHLAETLRFFESHLP